MREIYWSNMALRKYMIFYLAKYFAESVKINRMIKIIGAIPSCTSIAAWTIWKDFAFVWGIIIAISQVITAINEYLPYQQRIEEISNLKSELEKVYLCIEKEWYNIDNDKLSDEQIVDLLSVFDKEWDDIDNKYFTDDALPQNKDYKEYAESETRKYLNYKFGSC